MVKYFYKIIIKREKITAIFHHFKFLLFKFLIYNNSKIQINKK